MLTDGRVGVRGCVPHRDRTPVKSKDIDIEAHGPELVVTGEIKERERKGFLRRSTRRVVAFEYRLRLQGELDTHKIKAGMQDGALSITVPKAEAARPRRVQISEGAREDAAQSGGRRDHRSLRPHRAGGAGPVSVTAAVATARTVRLVGMVSTTRQSPGCRPVMARSPTASAPGRIHVQIAEMPEGQRYLWTGRAVTRHRGGWGDPARPSPSASAARSVTPTASSTPTAPTSAMSPRPPTSAWAAASVNASTAPSAPHHPSATRCGSTRTPAPSCRTPWQRT